MPRHSSKNYYKAELEEYHKLEEKEWDNWEHFYDYWSDGECASHCDCQKNTWSSAFDTKWTNVRRHTYEVPKATFPHRDCPCDFCKEYVKAGYSKEGIKENFTDQEILETLQEHLVKTNCWCYERAQSHMLLRQISRMLKPRRSSSIVFIPPEYEHNVLTPCVIRILSSKLYHQLEALHDQVEENKKRALLAKYGVTLEEYKQTRIERQVMLDELQKVEPKQEVSKQKFFKVRCQL